MSTGSDDHDLLAALVAFAPVTGTAGPDLAEFLAARLADAGARVETLPANRPGALNLVAEAGDPVEDDAGAAAGVTLSGHLDVVPPGDGWTSDPWVLTERDGRLVGRGACDMLGFVAVAANVLADHARAGRRSPLALVLTADEERGSLGAEALAGTWPAGRRLPRCCVVGEPTSLRAVRQHKGHAKVAFDLRGQAAHSGTPDLGRSTAGALTAVLAALEVHGRALTERRSPASAAFPEAPAPSLNVGRVVAGEAINMLADRATIEIGLRVLPGDDPAAAIDEVRAVVEAAVARWNRAAPEPGPPIHLGLRRLGVNPPLATPGAAASLARVRAAAPGDAGDDRGVAFASDGGHLAAGLGLEPVLCGPGDMAVAHRPDEWIAAADLVAARAFLERLVRRSPGPVSVESAP